MSKKPGIKKESNSTRQPKPTEVYELKITLQNSKPPIWRRVAVPSSISLSGLHEVIQIVMSWSNSHMHQFVIRNYRPKPTKEEMRGLVWSGQLDKLAMCMRRDRCLSDPQFEIEEAEDESRVMLCELAPKLKSKLIYEYDFGDSWKHLIEVVKISPPVEGLKYPLCIAGKHACPPEDCGGIWGYYEMLEAVKNPRHERHKEFADWLSPEFDPEEFDLEEINANLSNL
jgi:hypothetical protein